MALAVSSRHCLVPTLTRKRKNKHNRLNDNANIWRLPLYSRLAMTRRSFPCALRAGAQLLRV
uniref:Uncharacterized protein n=1 Tax=Candidatus Kentrum sp. MB TaxID=2138164 RepID=A0A450XHS7_9GAMM|nr:MAG: hypothetical protein BECKMB1821I_GA0114274_100754 [Candidatus Kentron sp. MB]